MDPLQGRLGRSRPTRFLYGVVAVVATAIGIVGIWLPGLPTTPFVLVGLWAGARSSEALSARMRRIRVLRAAIDTAEDYARTRALPMRLKILSQVMAYSAIVLVWLVTRTPWITAVVGCGALLSSVTMMLTATAKPAARATNP